MFKKFRTNRAVSRLVEDRLYELALDEVDKGILKRGPWARALSQSDGIDEKAKSIYLQFRVEAMKNEAQVINAVMDDLDERDDHSEIITASLKKNHSEQDRHARLINESTKQRHVSSSPMYNRQSNAGKTKRRNNENKNLKIIIFIAVFGLFFLLAIKNNW